MNQREKMTQNRELKEKKIPSRVESKISRNREANPPGWENLRNFLALVLIIPTAWLFLACRPASHQGHQEDAGEAEAPPAIKLAEASQSLIGVKIEVAEKREYLIPVRAAGRIGFNPKNYAVIPARCPGRVEEVLAYEGDRVQTGSILLRLYSPEHQALQAEFLQAKEKLSRSPAAEKEMVERMLSSALRRLQLLGIGEEEIRQLQESGKTEEFLAVRSPLSGSVINRSVNSGEYVETGQELFRVADLSLLWVEVSIYEKDLARLQIPGDCELQVEAYPGASFRGRITLMADILDESTRTVRLRAEVKNPDFRLKPGMYADVFVFPREREKILAVPEAAVRRLEGQDVIFVQIGQESFTLRPVRCGRSFSGMIEILEGLTEGETYVSEGSFALKSEWLKKTLEGDEHGHKH